MAESADTSASVVSSDAARSLLGSSDADAAAGAGLRVDFYVLEATSAAARLRLACRLAEKAYLSSQTALVWHTDPGELREFDELLWTFMDGSFVPHDLLKPDTPDAAAPVLLAANLAPQRKFDVIINLSTELPGCLDQAPRVVEIIDGDEGRRRAARARFKAYRDRGVQPATHTIREA